MAPPRSRSWLTVGPTNSHPPILDGIAERGRQVGPGRLDGGLLGLVAARLSFDPH